MATPRKDWEQIWKETAAESRKLAKRANQRLKRLETYSKRKGMSEILQYAYSKAQEYISKHLGVGKSGKGRYKEHIKLYEVNDGTKNLTGEDLYRANVQIQRARIKAMEEFLGSESSTLGESRSGKKTRGIKNLWSSRTNTINDKFLSKYGLELSDTDLQRFFEAKKQQKLQDEYGSSFMFVIAATMKKYNLKSEKRSLQKFFREHIDLKSLARKEGISEEEANDMVRLQRDTNGKIESKDDYIDRLKEFMDFTGDPVLNDYVADALKNGLSIKNLFF